MRRAAAAGVLAWLLCAGCGSGTPAGQPEQPSPTEPSDHGTGEPTGSPGPPPADPGQGSGEVTADLRQSSRDLALGRIQVWLVNGTDQDLDPRALVYRDPRLRRPIAAERLRTIPAGSFRGYPLPLPDRPLCGRPSGTISTSQRRNPVPNVTDGGGRLLVVSDTGPGVWRGVLRVADPNDLVDRFRATRCLELELTRVADLRFLDRVAVDRPGAGSTAVLTLQATPSGRPGHELVVQTVAGTPLISTVGGPVWRPRVTVSSDGPPVRIRLLAQPARCDSHAFLEAAGATAFRVRLRVDGEPGEVVLRMSPRGASRAIGFLVDSCGL